MTWKTAHPEADLTDISIPRCFDDMSWSNDAMPSFLFGNVVVWIDYRDPEMSDHPESRQRDGRFACSLYQDYGQSDGSDYRYSHFWHKILRISALRVRDDFRWFRLTGREVPNVGKILGFTEPEYDFPGRTYLLNGATRFIERCDDGDWQVVVETSCWKGANLKAAEWRLFCWGQYL